MSIEPLMLDRSVLEGLKARVSSLSPVRRTGYVNEIVVTTVKANLPNISAGELCQIESSDGRRILGEVIAFTENEATISCLESVVGISLGARVTPLGRPHCIKADTRLLSSVLDGMGRDMEQFSGSSSIHRNLDCGIPERSRQIGPFGN